MKLTHNLNLKQQHQLIMSPFLKYIVEIFQLPVLDLQQRISEELQENPMLELDEARNENEESLNEEFDESIMEKAESLLDYFGDSSDIGYVSYNSDDKKREFIEGTLTKPATLQEYLLWQLRLTTLDKDKFKIGESIISNIDDRGYLISSVEDIAKGNKVDVAEVEEVLKVIQTFEPYGVGARDLQETLLIQLKYYPEKNEWAERVIKNYFDLLSRGRKEEIRKHLGVSREAVENVLEFIKHLDPSPGHQYDSKKVEYVIPDVLIKKVDESDFIIVINDEWIPRVRVNKKYRELLKNNKVSNKTKKYLKNKFNYALWFIKSIEQRNTVLYKVSESIVKHQKNFFLKGPEYIVPLTLKDIAEDIEMHPSTVSRVTMDKYMQTPFGIYQMKHFFSTGIRSDLDEEVSSRRVMERIKDIVENENPGKPYSDEQIVKILEKEKIHIARRTVAKYRKILKILPSNLRMRK